MGIHIFLLADHNKKQTGSWMRKFHIENRDLITLSMNIRIIFVNITESCSDPWELQHQSNVILCMFFFSFLANNFGSYWSHKSEGVRGLEMQEKHITAAQRQLNFPAQQGSPSESSLLNICKTEKFDRHWRGWASLTTKRGKRWLR